MTSYCDTYLFCLWRRSFPFWRRMVVFLRDLYDVDMVFESEFPRSLKTLRRFYGNERLVGGYEKKLDDIGDRFLFMVCRDGKMNDFKKLLDAKRRLRALSGIKDDYNFMHSSSSMEELTRQTEIIGRFPWR